MKHLPLKDKLLILSLSLFCTSLIAAASLIIYWLHIQSNPPIVVNNEPLPVTSPLTVYQPGDTITFHLDFCRHTTGAIRFTRRWIDGLMYIEPETYVSGGERECLARDLIATVPNLPPGLYHVEYNVIYKVNPLAERAVTFRTQPFEVTAP